MRLTGRSSQRLLLVPLGLLLLIIALWGLYRSYPDFTTLRQEPASIQLPLPSASVAPSTAP